MGSAFGPAASDDVHPDAERMRILILDDQVEKATDDALAMGFHVHLEGNPPPSEGPPAKTGETWLTICSGRSQQ